MKNIQNELIETEMRITDLSRMSNISRQTIYEIMKGNVTPKIPTVKALCDVLGLNYKDYIPY